MSLLTSLDLVSEKVGSDSQKAQKWKQAGREELNALHMDTYKAASREES